MPYMQQLASSLSGLVSAGEAGREGVDGMLSPLNGAIGSITGAASELENIPFVGPEAGAKLGRIVRSINVAQSRVGQVAATYSSVVTGAAQVQERLGTFKQMASKVTAEAKRVAGLVSPSLSNILPTGGLQGSSTPLPEAVAPFPHLLIIQPHDPKLQPYCFNLDTAPFDELRRQASYRWAGQERLRRSVAQQAVGLGEEKITLKGAIFPHHKGGIGQLKVLRSIGGRLQALKLVTGYGEVLGDWCLVSVEEEQSNLLAGGIPRKQGFTLEFVSYGNDLQNV